MRSRERSGGAGPTAGGSSQRGGEPRRTAMMGSGAGEARRSALHSVGRLCCGSAGGRLPSAIAGSSGRQHSGAKDRAGCSAPSSAASSSASLSDGQQGCDSRAPSMLKQTNTGSAGRSAAHSTKQQIRKADKRRTFSTLQRSRGRGNVISPPPVR